MRMMDIAYQNSLGGLALMLPFYFILFCLFEVESYYVVLTSVELKRLAYLCLLSAGIKGTTKAGSIYILRFLLYV